MPKVVDVLARKQLRIARTGEFDLLRADTELTRLAEAGVLHMLTKGLYALVPEDRRGAETAWRPTIEGAALGIAAALHGPDAVALVGPSAARAHGCYPRALGIAYVSVPKQRRARRTSVGLVRFVERQIDKLDTVRVDTDLGPGWATSIEHTALDLSRDRPSWDVADEARKEMIQRLAARADWELIDEIAETTRGIKTLARLRTEVGRDS